jgi:hypothetical protein
MRPNSNFSGAKPGDRVWGFVSGWGTIKEVNFNETFSILVYFDNGHERFYNIDGRSLNSDINPTLFWDEITFQIPEPPKRTVKVKRWVNIYKLCGYKYLTDAVLFQTKESATKRDFLNGRIVCCEVEVTLPEEFANE